MTRSPWRLLPAILLLLAGTALPAQEAGRIEGRVSAEDGTAIGGVSVLLRPSERTAVTGAAGTFAFAGVPAGDYSLSFRLGELAAPASEVVVTAGETTRLDKTLEWNLSFAETITVASASRRRERLVDAPTAVTKVDAGEIALGGGGGQLPALLQFTVGAETTQSGLYDFNFNSRGMNGFLTRRIQTLVDGRDFGIPETSSQEWTTLGAFRDDLESIELVRGPSAALYGANSVNGVLSLTTKAPRDSQGGRLRLTLGELDTRIADGRWAGSLGDGWYLKALASHTESDSFTRSRTETVEYPGLTPDVLAPAPGGVDVDSGSARVDKYRDDGGLFTLESGVTEGGGETFLNQTGRAQQLTVKRWWSRFNYNARRWNFAATYNDRFGDQVTLNSGAPLYTDSWNYKLELQGNRQLAGGRLRLVGGVSWVEENIDSADPDGVQTLFLEPVRSDEQAVFGQLDVDLRDDLKLVLAGRWDDGTLHDPQFSPKAALVYQPAARHTLRAGFNRAFQVGNYTETFLNVPVGAVDLSPVEAALAPLLGGVPLGLEAVTVQAFGNPDLEVEKIHSVELGYHGILSDRVYLTVDVYHNWMKDFISDLLFGINPAYPPYRAPSLLPPPVAALVEGTLNSLVPGLTNDPAGAALIVLSNTNTGRAESQGVEVAFSYQPHRRWLLDLNYSWFDLEIQEQVAGAEIRANAPEHKAALAVSYRGEQLAASLGYRWVEAFDWASGIWAGPVPSYTVINLDLAYRLSERWEIGVNVANALDNEHYQVFGGDLLERRALGHVSFSW